MANSKKYPPLGMANRLDELMKAQNMSNVQLGKLCGIDRRQIEAYRLGETSMNTTVCLRICRVLHTTPNYLITGRK